MTSPGEDASQDEGRRRGRITGGRTRMCALTREVGPETQLLRFVAAPDGSVVADIRAKLPGRGVWLGLDRNRIAEAIRKKVFARGLKAPVKAPVDLPDQVAAQLREACLGRLGLARRAGALLAGFAKVEAAVLREDLAGLLSASDAAEDGRRKMAQAVHRRYGDVVPFPELRIFTATELGLATGLPNVIHAAVLQSPAGRSFVEAALRLQRYEGVGGGLSDSQAIDRADEQPQGVTHE